MKSDKFKDAFSFIIIDAYLQFCKDGKKEYVPEAVKNCKIDWVGEGAENTSINNFLGEFVITDNEEDFIRSSEIDLWLKEAKLNISINKFALDFKKYCSIKKHINVVSKNKKLNGKCLKVWTGIKKMTNDDDDEEMPKSALDI